MDDTPSLSHRSSLRFPPRLKRRRRPRFKGPSFNRIIPNILTLIGLCAGLIAMRFALEGHFAAAAISITVAGCIDGLDGRIARLLRATSHFGAEFDSLSDFLCDGKSEGGDKAGVRPLFSWVGASILSKAEAAGRRGRK